MQGQLMRLFKKIAETYQNRIEDCLTEKCTGLSKSEIENLIKEVET